MPTPPLTDEECIKAVAAYHRHYKSNQRAAKELGITRCAFQRRLKKAADRGLMGFRPVLPGFAVSETSVQRDHAGNVQKEWIPAGIHPAGNVIPL